MSRQARVGLLVLAGALLFLVVLFTIANRTFIFADTFYARSSFRNVAGLLEGASVQYQGVNVGRVERVILPTQPGAPIMVDMAIQQKARHLITRNTQAQIQTDGLVGNMIIVLVASEEVAELAQEGDILPGVEPFSISAVTDQALASVERFNQAAETMQSIMEDVRRGEGTLGKILYDPTLYNSVVNTTNETQALMANLGRDAQSIVGIAQTATQGVNDILTRVQTGDGTLARLLNDPTVYNRLNQAVDTLLTISGDVRLATRNAEQLTAWGTLGAFRFAELMEAAKHNWLFRRYFEERGYVEQAPFELREQAIRSSVRDIQQRERELLEWQERLEARESVLPSPQR